MATITKEWLQREITSIESARDDMPFGLDEEQSNTLAALKIALASLEATASDNSVHDLFLRAKALMYQSGGSPIENSLNPVDAWLFEAERSVLPVAPLYTAPPVPATERNRIRRDHAEWSQDTFGDVGPIGPLKHLSKEALEAAAEPGDLSEWADMQFLLWDAQRRAGISDEQITQAMIEKLAVNKQRQWPKPKDGEPRMHIKPENALEVPEEVELAIINSVSSGLRDHDMPQRIWDICRAAMLKISGE